MRRYHLQSVHRLIPFPSLTLSVSRAREERQLDRSECYYCLRPCGSQRVRRGWQRSTGLAARGSALTLRTFWGSVSPSAKGPYWFHPASPGLTVRPEGDGHEKSAPGRVVHGTHIREGYLNRSHLPWVSPGPAHVGNGHSLVDLPLRPVFASRVFVQRPDVGTLAVRSCRVTGGREEHVLWLCLI